MQASRILPLGLLMAAILAPLPALAAPAYVPSTVNLRAGPGTNYPIVSRIKGDTLVEVRGCLRDWSWCDVKWKARKNRRDENGWVSARFLQAAYRNRNGDYIITPRKRLDAPVIRFEIASYWDEYYQDNDFYHDRRSYMRGRENEYSRDDRRDWDGRDRNWNQDRDRNQDRDWNRDNENIRWND